MTNAAPRYRRHRFPIEIISHAVWLYHRFCLSFRDVEDLLAENVPAEIADGDPLEFGRTRPVGVDDLIAATRR